MQLSNNAWRIARWKQKVEYPDVLGTGPIPSDCLQGRGRIDVWVQLAGGTAMCRSIGGLVSIYLRAARLMRFALNLDLCGAGLYVWRQPDSTIEYRSATRRQAPTWH